MDSTKRKKLEEAGFSVFSSAEEFLDNLFSKNHSENQNANKGFVRLDSDLQNWLDNFPEKGWLAMPYSDDLQMLREAIYEKLVTESGPPYYLTKRGKRLKAKKPQDN